MTSTIYLFLWWHLHPTKQRRLMILQDGCTLYLMWKSHKFGEKTNGPIWSLASDGDLTYHAAKFKICMEKIIETNSYFGKVSKSLLGLNQFTSVDGVTLTGDPKHIFKWFATLLWSL